jgi:VWFA-related protein
MTRLAGALVVLLPALLAAQSQPRFSTGVDLIVVPVIARNADNTFARGLTQSDFELREDGKPVSIATFAAVDTDAPASLDDGRFIVLLLDDLASHASYTTRIKDVARSFANRMGPKDVMSVVLLNGGSSVTTQRRSEVLAAIDRAKSFGKAALAPGLNSTRHAMDTIASLSTQLARVQHRRKVLVAIGPSQTFNPQMQNVNSRGEAAAALRESATANLATYVIDPLGLTATPRLSGQPVDAGAASYPGVVTRGEGFKLYEDGFAFDTGGVAFANTNQYERAVDQVWEESGNYYLLGYEPARRDNRRHSIAVKVRKPDIAIRSRLLR